MKFFLTLVCMFILSTVSVEAQRNLSALERKRGEKAEHKPSFDSQTGSELSNRDAESGPESHALSYHGPDAPVKILRKPGAAYPPGGMICARGSVLLKVHFLADGSIGQIFVVRGLPLGLSEQAVKAAREIEFIPKIAKGIYVSSMMVVEYKFTIY